VLSESRGLEFAHTLLEKHFQVKLFPDFDEKRDYFWEDYSSTLFKNPSLSSLAEDFFRVSNKISDEINERNKVAKQLLDALHKPVSLSLSDE
jgi:hypothetical protein